MKKTKLLFSLLIVFLLISCTNKASITKEKLPAGFYAYPWRLVWMDGQAISADLWLTMKFDQHMKIVKGDSGCNTFFGPIKVKKFWKIAIGPFKTTRRNCLAEKLKREKKFLDLLQKSNKYKLLGDELHLFDGNKLLLQFYIYLPQQKPKN